MQVFIGWSSFRFFSISGWGIDLDYCDIEWFVLEINRDHSVIFEIAPKYCILASLVAQTVKRLPAMRQTRVRVLGREDALEKEIAICSSTLAWKIPWMEEPDRLHFMGLQRVRHD